MKIEVAMKDNLMEALEEIPKTGLDYQVADVRLADGSILEDVLIYDSGVAVLEKDLYTAEIVEILG